MNRRGFLKVAVAAPIAIAMPKILVPAETMEMVIARYSFRTVAMGFALTEEMVSVPPRLSMSGMLRSAIWAEQLREGLHAVFSREYDAVDEREWKKMYLGDFNDVPAESIQVDARVFRSRDSEGQDGAEPSLPRRGFGTRSSRWWDEI